MSRSFAEFDEIGYWSEIKLEIVRDYASAYSRILTAKKLPHIYVDAFAGAGQHISKSTGEFVPGSPTNALNVRPPFREYHFIDLNAAKIENLQRMAGARKDVHIYEGDCNEVLIKQIFPTLRYESYRRALCLLDPYGLNLQWQVIFQAGQLGTVDMFAQLPCHGYESQRALAKPRQSLGGKDCSNEYLLAETNPGRTRLTRRRKVFLKSPRRNRMRRLRKHSGSGCRRSRDLRECRSHCRCETPKEQ